MWIGVWKHECDDGTIVQRESETALHPVHGHGMPARCEACQGGWKLSSWQGPVKATVRKRRRRTAGYGWRALQLELFDSI